MESMLKRSVKDVVAEDFRAAAIFEKYSIDFCCRGGQPLEVACGERNVDPAKILEELQQLRSEIGTGSFRPTEWELDVLADFIVNNHHRYVRRMLPIIMAHVDKVLAVHGTNHPSLARIAEAFHAVADELTRHMHKEEIVLFPHIRTLLSAEREGRSVVPPPFGSVRNPIRMMESEHSAAGGWLEEIRGVSNNFTPPPDACTTFRITYGELEEFERDLHQHVHLENNILFPKAIELEDRVFARVATGG